MKIKLPKYKSKLEWHKKFIIWPTIIYDNGVRYLVFFTTLEVRMHYFDWEYRLIQTQDK